MSKLGWGTFLSDFGRLARMFGSVTSELGDGGTFSDLDTPVDIFDDGDGTGPPDRAPWMKKED
jgi:hypothetical protein